MVEVKNCSIIKQRVKKDVSRILKGRVLRTLNIRNSFLP